MSGVQVLFLLYIDMLLPPTAAVNGQTPLSLACAKEHLNVTQYLVEERHCDPKGMCVCMVKNKTIKITDQSLCSKDLTPTQIIIISDCCYLDYVVLY